MTETRELATRSSRAGAISMAQSESERRFDQTIQMVRETMLNPDVDANKAKVMADLMTSLEDRALQAQFNRDLNAALFEMPVVTKAGIIVIPSKDGKPARTQGRFARFEDIDRVVRPILERHNLAIRFEVGESQANVTVRPILTHRNGFTERGEAMRLPLDSSGAKNNVQGSGSAVSYGKRYTMCAALNIITEGTDDDGSLGRHAIDMPHEREVAVLEEAEEAAAAGADAYRDWYARQSVKDRGWLVSSGHHMRLGGDAPALTGPGRSRAAAPAEPQESRDAPQEAQRPAPPETTPEDWTRAYEARCDAAPDMDALLRIQARAETAIGRLKANHPDLYDRAVEAGAAAIRRIKASDDGDEG